MGSFWKRDGKVIVDGSKRPIFCDTCPCEDNPDDCYADVIAAIRERQPAVGRTQWAESVEKTLAQCIAETNAIALGRNTAGDYLYPFILGSYSGGSSLPTMIPSGWADDCADFCELYDYIACLVTMKIAFTRSTSSGMFRWYSSGYNDQWSGDAGDGSSSYDFSTLVATAEANWHNAGGAGTSDSKYWAYKSPKRSGINRAASICAQQQTYYVTGLSASTSRAARAFLRVVQDDVYPFHNLGYHSIAEGDYAMVASKSTGTWSTWTVPAWPASGTLAKPSPWPADPVSPSTDASRHGFKIVGRFLLVDWSFAHTGSVPTTTTTTTTTPNAASLAPFATMETTPNAASLAPFATMETPPPARPVGIHAIWLAEAPKMAAATGAAHDLYMAHEAAIECRSDLTDCQKNARRRMVLEYWYAEQGRAAEQSAPPKPADAPATAWRDPRTGPGIPR